MYYETSSLAHKVYRDDLVRAADQHRLAQLAQQEPSAPRRSLLTRFARYIGIFLVL